MRRSLIPVVALVVLAACSPGTASTTTPTSEPTTSTTPAEPSTTTSATAAPSTTTTLSLDGLVLPVARDEMPGNWREVLFIPYGDTPDTLGTSPGGDGGSVKWGPEYGAQAPDGSWWFLDAAKLRLAHFDADGSYIEQVEIPESMLVNGTYFQWSMPRIMDDGTLVAARFGDSTLALLRYREGTLDEVSVPVMAVPRYHDGETIYAFSFDDGSLWAVDPLAGTAEPADQMTGRDGSRFSITVSSGRVRVVLPDAGVEEDLVFSAEQVGGEVGFAIEVATDHEGGIHILLVGGAMEDESPQLAGYVLLGRDGSLRALDPVMNPFTESDPGTPARLGVMPGTTRPTFMVIGIDGVRVFTRG